MAGDHCLGVRAARRHHAGGRERVESTFARRAPLPEQAPITPSIRSLSVTFDTIHDYAQSLARLAGASLGEAQIFAKVLTRNDDSGRHGVLVPSDAYAILADWNPRDPSVNDTLELRVFDVISRTTRTIAYKYYERYPERRVTRLNSMLNDSGSDRLLVILSVGSTDGDRILITDCTSTAQEQRFDTLWALLSSGNVSPEPGAFLVVPASYTGLVVDDPLSDLLGRFDAIRNRWFESLREGDTGIGYTFEALLGIKENNDRTADFRGIELKCKRLRAKGGSAVGKVNLFQQGPVWIDDQQSALGRVRMLGKPDRDGLFRCLSQVTTQPNNLCLLLDPKSEQGLIALRRTTEKVGHWPHALLEKRLIEKHSRAAFVLAEVRQSSTRTSFSYNELIYCEKPTIGSFIDLVERDRIVFEFLMYENADGTVRNRGYPWRLLSEGLLDQLFSVRVKLR